MTLAAMLILIQPLGHHPAAHLRRRRALMSMPWTVYMDERVVYAAVCTCLPAVRMQVLWDSLLLCGACISVACEFMLTFACNVDSGPTARP